MNFTATIEQQAIITPQRVDEIVEKTITHIGMFQGEENARDRHLVALGAMMMAGMFSPYTDGRNIVVRMLMRACGCPICALEAKSAEQGTC